MAEFHPAELSSLLGEALELPEGERERFATQRAGHNPALLRELMRLLGKAAQVPEDFLDPARHQAAQSPRGLIGTQLGNYQVVDILGRGAAGTVYRAIDRHLNRDVALKVFALTASTGERELERFRREVRSAAKIRHPHIVAVYEYGETGELHWFAMEYVPGHDLETELNAQRARLDLDARSILPRPDAPFHFTEIARVCAEAAEALEHAHLGGLVHRDIKPANLLLHRDGRVLISDFGISRDSADPGLTRTGELHGTPYYMSPEQARALADPIDNRTDIYSLGVVLYELLTLRRPFEGATAMDVLLQIREAEARSPRRYNPAIPRDLDVICTKAMAKRPASRYQRAGEFAADLRRFLGHLAIHASPPSYGERARAWLRKHRMSLAAVLLAALGLFAGKTYADHRALQRTLGALGVEILTAAGEPARGAVRAQVLDFRTGMPAGEIRELGPLPVRGRRLPPARYRITAALSDGSHLEYAQTVEAGAEHRIRGRAPGPGARESMVRIEGGTLRLRDENRPLSQLNFLDVPVPTFYLDATEVSNGEYRRFLEATGHPPPEHWDAIQPGTHDHLPVVMVHYRDADAYAAWAGKRLPTFAELSFAARGEAGWLYPWGPEPVDGELLGNVNQPRFARDLDPGVANYLASVAPVDSFPEARSRDGIYHLFGNVAELTESTLAAREELTGPFLPQPARRLVLASAWDAAASKQTLMSLGWAGPDAAFMDYRLGFRCASSFR